MLLRKFIDTKQKCWNVPTLTPINRNKRGDRRARRNKRSGGPVSMTGNLSLSKQFELRMSNTVPSMTFRAKYAAFSTSNVVLNSIVLQPSTMGQPTAVLAGNFSRYRIIKAIFKHVPQNGSNAAGRVYMGVADDNGGEGGSSVVPQDYLQITELRTSTNISLGGEGEFQWKPLDPNKWYYTYTTTGNDGRQSVPATFYSVTDGFGNSGAFNTRIEAFFTLEFAGNV